MGQSTTLLIAQLGTLAIAASSAVAAATQVVSVGLSAAFTAVTAVRVGFHLGRGDVCVHLSPSSSPPHAISWESYRSGWDVRVFQRRGLQNLVRKREFVARLRTKPETRFRTKFYSWTFQPEG